MLDLKRARFQKKSEIPRAVLPPAGGVLLVLILQVAESTKDFWIFVQSDPGLPGRKHILPRLLV